VSLRRRRAEGASQALSRASCVFRTTEQFASCRGHSPSAALVPQHEVLIGIFGKDVGISLGRRSPRPAASGCRWLRSSRVFVRGLRPCRNRLVRRLPRAAPVRGEASRHRKRKREDAMRMPFNPSASECCVIATRGGESALRGRGIVRSGDALSRRQHNGGVGHVFAMGPAVS